LEFKLIIKLAPVGFRVADLVLAFSPPNPRLFGTWGVAPGYDRSRLQRANASVVLNWERPVAR
jgi:hypothetical protein